MRVATRTKIMSNVHIWAEDLFGNRVYDVKRHNCFLDNGHTWLSQVLAYNTAGYVRADPPPDVEPDVGAPGPYERTLAAPVTTAAINMPYLPFYIGLGVGGNQQSGPMPVDVDPQYPGTNVQSDADPTVPGLERPVRVTTDGATWARWLNPVVVTIPGPLPYTYTRFTSTFAVGDINTGTKIGGGDYANVPLAEAAMYYWTNAPDSASLDYIPPNPPLAFVQGQAIAYDTFPTLNKTAALVVVVQWDLIHV
jgi:hypothetical protein